MSNMLQRLAGGRVVVSQEEVQDDIEGGENMEGVNEEGGGGRRSS
jgi:hypothetical protein